MVRPITFLSDFGGADEFVGVVHAVIARELPDALVIDLGHGVPRGVVQTGALMLVRALPFAPPGVHLAVVDPGVGSDRRALALRTAREDRLLVGPDNGLLIPAAERFGGISEAVEISSSPWRLEPVSATFHGRDVFAPVAAHLAAGEELELAGAPLDPSELVRLELPRPRLDADGVLIAHVVDVDWFGNVGLDASHVDLAIEPGHDVVLSLPERSVRACFVRTFAEVAAGELLLYVDSSGTLSLAVNGGEAASELGGLRLGDEIRIAPG
jgi:S-adenosyl-L-methionine hydrolase (adenosine-forming)